MYKIIYNIVKVVFKSNYFGFINTQSIHGRKIIDIEPVHYDFTKAINFEDKFSKLIGNGQSVSFASARMCVYAFLKSIKLNSSYEEVLIPGYTCSVMINAILKAGYSPVYYDIDLNNFGSSLEILKPKINPKTKVIIVQHTFGIPCNIEPIIKYANSLNIFTIEDCALTLGSKINNINVGNFADISIFSLDHTKPINTIIGGILYTKNKNIYNNINKIRQQSGNLPTNRITAALKQYQIESKFNRSNKYNLLYILTNFNNFISKLRSLPVYYLDEDYGTNLYNFTYLYPSRYPVSLIDIANESIDNWKKIEESRIKIFYEYLNFFKKTFIYNYLPKVYFDNTIKIVPSRFVFLLPNNSEFKNYLSKFLDTNSFWFQAPIIATNEPLNNFKYIKNTCPNSENSNYEIINLPCYISSKEQKLLLDQLRSFFK